MEGQMTFEFDKRPTIKGYPELRWTGKRPYESTQYYPAQLRERYGEETNGWINKIFWGDNLQVMSHLLKEYRGKIDLIYIDPPFDSKADYKKKIKMKNTGTALSDTSTFEEKQYGDIWTNDEYLQFMYERFILIRELLSERGSLYVHCDWHKVHHLRMVLDEVFGPSNFRNEVIWWYLWGGRGKTQWNSKHDNILFYSKSDNWTFNYMDVLDEHTLMTEGSKNRLNYAGAMVTTKSENSEIPQDKVLPSDTWYIATINAMAKRYGGKTYEGLLPKLAIFAANVKEATDVVRPAVEKVLGELGISLSTVLVNTGDPSVTKDEDIKNFNNLDVIGTEGSKKQFIILVEKGREGWNCRSLLGIALFRSPKSKVFVLQATMRCLRQLTKEQLKATIFLSKENYDTLDDELRKNYNMEISDFGKSQNTNKKVYKVRVLPPPRSIKMKRLWHEYSLIEKEYSVPIDFHLAELDESKYEAKMYEKGSLRLGLSEKETNIDSMKEQERFSKFSLTAEISRYMNISCLTIAKILRESVDGSDNIVAAVNRHNEILEDVIIPEIFHTLYEVKSTQKSEDVDMVLLREPKDSGYYEFSANDELVITKGHNNFTPKEEAKSFHADTYCFDSKPEKECFLQYISSNKVREIYFTGMFTSNQGDLSVQYYDPESKRLRKYYPDFLALMEDGSYQLIEVKGDNKIDDEVVLAKKAAAEEMAVASGIHYLMYAGSTLMKSNVLEPTLVVQQASIEI